MPAVVIFIGSLIAAVGTYLKFHESVIFTGAFISALGAVLASYNQNKFEKELKKKNDEIIELNQKIGAISIHTINMVTGGDSFAHIQFSAINDGENMHLDKIFLQQEGIYPLYDLTISIFDVDSLKSLTVFKVGDIGSVRHIKFFPLNQSINFDLAGKLDQRFNVFFYSRNGTWYQQIFYKKINIGWVIATRVVRPDEKNEPFVIFKSISPDFPIAEHEIPWQ